MSLFICIEIQSLSNKSGNTFLKIDLADFCRIVNGRITFCLTYHFNCYCKNINTFEVLVVTINVKNLI